MSSSCLLLLLLCSSLVCSKQVPVEYGTNQDRNVTLRANRTLKLDEHVTELPRTNIIEKRHISTRQAAEKDTIPKVKASYVHLPEEQIRCNIDTDCTTQHDLPLRCGPNGLCECTDGLCWSYYTDTTKWPVVNVFTCATCGILGSSCNETISCMVPGTCLMDGYCHCRHNGEHDENGICWIADTSWAMTIAVGAMGIILLFACGVTVYNLYVTRPWRNGCGRRSATPDVLHHNVTEGETIKTPAYTVRDYYGYTPVTLPQEGPQPEQVDGELASTSSTTAEVDDQIACTSTSVTEVDSETPSTSTSIVTEENDIQELNHSETKPPASEDSGEGSDHQDPRYRVNESTSNSSVRSSISSNASTVNSERALVSSSGNSTTQNGLSRGGFSIGRVFNKDQRRRDEVADSTRF